MIPLEAIIGVVIALMVFIPACIGVSKYFRTSQQAETSFQELVDDLSAFSSSSDLEDVAVLKMDAETAIIGFTRNSPVYFNGETIVRMATEEVFGPGVPATRFTSERYFSVPVECTIFPCVCLCQQFETGTKTITGIDDAQLSRTELNCQQKACEVVPQIKLARDFVIVRENEQEARRIEIALTKQNGGVVVATR